MRDRVGWARRDHVLRRKGKMMMVTNLAPAFRSTREDFQICSDDPGEPVPLAKLNFILFCLYSPPHLSYKSSQADDNAAASPMSAPTHPRLGTFPLGPFTPPRLWVGLWQLSSTAWGSAPASRIREAMARHVDQGYTAFGKREPLCKLSLR
jgi:hypothetical protein